MGVMTSVFSYKGVVSSVLTIFGPYAAAASRWAVLPDAWIFSDRQLTASAEEVRIAS